MNQMPRINGTPFFMLTAMLAVTGLGISQAHAEASITWRSNLRKAFQEAAEVQKPMLVEVSTTWCGYCKKMDKETFTDSRIIDHISECFVPVKIDGEQQRDFVKKVGIRSYPTTVIVGPDMQVLAKITGYRSPDQLDKDLSGICDRNHTTNVAPIANAPVMRASAFGNLCPVNPVENGKFVVGQPELVLPFRGYQLQFASKENLEMFRRNPAKYWPSADGQCVVSYFDQRASKMGKVDLGIMYNDRIWFFASEEHLERFKQSPDRYAGMLRQVEAQMAARNTPRRPTGSNSQ